MPESTIKIDTDALREKYREERDKRLRPEGNAQYLEPTGRFAHFVGDPHVPIVERAPRFDEVTVAVIGAGFGGLCTAAMLREAGVDSVRLIEGGGDVGGAWYWNRYPGAMCDTASMIYLPLLEETGHMPTHKYAYGPEIRAHARRIATHYGLYDDALFSTEVTSLDWDEVAARWVVRTNRGDVIAAKHVAMGTGPLHRPKLPGIPGIETFSGHCFHTSRWDYSYTGGDDEGAPMDRLATKRVGLIGTGATAVQCVPPLARDAGELYVFQRTPSSIDVRGNHQIDPAWFGGLQPGWQREWQMNFATLQTGGFADEDLVMDGWTDISTRIRDRVVAMMDDSFSPETLVRAYEESDDEKMTEIRARVDAVVRDATTAAALKPWYRQLCKRPCFHDEYLDAYNVATAHLVDTDGKGVERIDEAGAWVAGTHYDVDCLIFGSGFEVGTEYARRNGFETTGVGGETLSERWADGMRTLHGVHVRGFPNLYLIGFVQAANLVSNITQNLADAARTITAVVAHAEGVGARVVEPTNEAEDAWVSLIATSERRFLGDPSCTPGYYNNEGAPMGPREHLNMAGYPLGAVAYFEYIDAWRRAGTFQGIEFSAGGAT